MFDIKEYLEDRGIEYFEGGSENTSADFISIQCPNPLCSDKLNHCGIHPYDLYFNCWICGEKGSVKQIIKWVDNCDQYEAYKILKHEFQNDIEYEDQPKEQTLKKHKIYNNKRLPTGAIKQFPPKYLAYLESRGYDAKTLIDKYDLYATGWTGDYRWRIIIPYYLNGQIITYSGKDITGKSKQPYKHCSIEKSILDPKKTLYNIDNCSNRSCAVVEGCFDVFRIGDGAVATSGTQYTEEQVDMLCSYGFERIIVAYDFGAYEQGHKLAKLLSSVVPEVLQVELLRGDPDTLPEKDVQKIRRLLI